MTRTTRLSLVRSDRSGSAPGPETPCPSPAPHTTRTVTTLPTVRVLPPPPGEPLPSRAARRHRNAHTPPVGVNAVHDTGSGHTMGALALASRASAGRTAPSGSRLRLVTDETDTATSRAPSQPPDEREARVHALWFARLLVEVLPGARPVGQLASLTTPEILDRIEALGHRLRRHCGEMVHSFTPRYAQAPAPGVAEAGVRLRVDDQSLIVAFRLERTQRPGPRAMPWQCTALVHTPPTATSHLM